MKKYEFDKIIKYVNDENIIIHVDDWFNAAGWFWLNLTPKQAETMRELLEEQRCPVVIDRGRAWYELRNGMRLLKEGYI